MAPARTSSAARSWWRDSPRWCRRPACTRCTTSACSRRIRSCAHAWCWRRRTRMEGNPSPTALNATKRIAEASPCAAAGFPRREYCSVCLRLTPSFGTSCALVGTTSWSPLGLRLRQGGPPLLLRARMPQVRRSHATGRLYHATNHAEPRMAVPRQMVLEILFLSAPRWHQSRHWSRCPTSPR